MEVLSNSKREIVVNWLQPKKTDLAKEGPDINLFSNHAGAAELYSGSK